MTRDTFTEVLSTYTFTALSGDTIYSFASDASRFIRCIAFSNGDDFITYNGEDGTFELGLYTTTTLQALNQYYEWMNGPTKDTMMVTTDTNAYNLNNYGIVPYPNGPEAEPGYYKTYCESTDFTICIPIMAQDPEATAVVMDSLYEPLDGYETKESIIEYLDKNYFLDSRDSAFFYEIADRGKTYFLQTTDGLYDIWPELVAKTASEALAKYEDFLKERTEKYLIPHLVTAYQIYPD